VGLHELAAALVHLRQVAADGVSELLVLDQLVSEVLSASDFTLDHDDVVIVETNWFCVHEHADFAELGEEVGQWDLVEGALLGALVRLGVLPEHLDDHVVVALV